MIYVVQVLGSWVSNMPGKIIGWELLCSEWSYANTGRFGSLSL